jgi:hypothetical protein
MLELAIYTVLMSLPCSSVETLPEKEVRMHVIATAITHAVDRATCYEHDYTCDSIWGNGRVKLAAMLVTKAYHETRLDRDVHEGRCSRYRCGMHRDPRTGEWSPQSITLWQLERPPTMTVERFRALAGAGLPETYAAAWQATVRLAAGWYVCKSREAGAFSHYATGNHCTWKGGGARSAMSLNVESRIWIELHRKTSNP